LRPISPGRSRSYRIPRSSHSRRSSRASCFRSIRGSAWGSPWCSGCSFRRATFAAGRSSWDSSRSPFSRRCTSAAGRCTRSRNTRGRRAGEGGSAEKGISCVIGRVRNLGPGIRSRNPGGRRWFGSPAPGRRCRPETTSRPKRCGPNGSATPGSRPPGITTAGSCGSGWGRRRRRSTISKRPWRRVRRGAPPTGIPTRCTFGRSASRRPRGCRKRHGEACGSCGSSITGRRR